MTSLATIAGDEFARRRATASRKVAAGKLHHAEAHDLVLPWLAIACLAGTDLPELADDLATIGTFTGRTTDQARVTLARELCPPALVRDTLRRAAASAITLHEARPTAETLSRGRALLALARSFRVGAIPLAPQAPATPAPEQAAPPLHPPSASASQGSML